MPAKSKKEKSFKEMFEELKDINSWFEDEDIDLDEGLSKLKSGKELIEKCRSKLVEVENEFEELTKDIANEPEVEDMPEEEPPTVKKVRKELPF